MLGKRTKVRQSKSRRCSHGDATKKKRRRMKRAQKKKGRKKKKREERRFKNEKCAMRKKPSLKKRVG
jgi:hypothetical protein